MQPLARRDDLTIEEMRGETLVYDLRNHKAHSLNRTAAAVWQSCDGASNLSQIAGRVTERVGTPADEDVIRTALADLQRAQLLESGGELPVERISRRQVAAGALLMPVVASILVPTSAAAKSGPDKTETQVTHGNPDPGGHDNGKGNGGIPGNGKGNQD